MAKRVTENVTGEDLLDVYAQAREWLLDQGDPDDEGETSRILDVDDDVIRRRIVRLYGGGWRQFVQEHARLE